MGTQTQVIHFPSDDTRMNVSSLDDRAGLYILALKLPRRRSLSIGKLGCFIFPAGYYQYIGSAGRGVRSRVRRHLEKRGIRHWHLDYLMPYVSVIGIHAFYEPVLSECELANRAEYFVSGSKFPPGFGASDCRCGGHLIRHESLPEWVPV